MSVALNNIFEVPAGNENEFIAAWEKTPRLPQTFPVGLSNLAVFVSRPRCAGLMGLEHGWLAQVGLLAPSAVQGLLTMSWTVYIPTAITGVVGLAGIGGSIWSARIASRVSTTNLMRSIDAEGDRTREAEKRRLYAANLTAFNEVVSALVEYATSKHSSSSNSADEKRAALSRFTHSHEDMNRSLKS